MTLLHHPYAPAGSTIRLILFNEHLKALRGVGKDQVDMGFGLLLTGDEEVGGANGAGVAVGDLNVDFFLALDGGGLERIVTKEKGFLHLELTSKGRAAHGARPWLGANAFDRLLIDYRTVQKLFEEEAEGHAGDHWHKTLVLSNCTVGDGSINKVPDTATATLDIRYTEREDPDALICAIRAALTYSTLKLHAKEPLFFSSESAYLELLLKAAGKVVTVSEHGASDARYLSSRGIPGVVWGAEGEMSQHSAQEHLVVDGLGPLYDRLDRFQTAVDAGEGD